MITRIYYKLKKNQVVYSKTGLAWAHTKQRWGDTPEYNNANELRLTTKAKSQSSKEAKFESVIRSLK